MRASQRTRRLVLLPLLGACAVSDSGLPAGAERFEPPAVYAKWWALTEQCSRRSGDVRDVSWYRVAHCGGTVVCVRQCISDGGLGSPPGKSSNTSSIFISSRRKHGILDLRVPIALTAPTGECGQEIPRG